MRNIQINKFTLDNGLRVVHYQDSTTPMVVVNTLYDVGSKDESPNHTGFAHLMEHLMFGGSVNVPSFDDISHKAGGYNNAWTSNDVTNFYDMVPKDNVESFLHIESDRMLSLSFSLESLNVQRKVVCEEFKQRYLNQPYGDVEDILREIVFKQHPYQWTPIGKELGHIEKTTIEDVKEFFYAHYAPNNAIISIVGNISFEETKRLIDKWYSDIPYRKIATRNIPHEPAQTEERKKEVTRDVPNDMIIKAYRAPGIKEKDYYVTDFLTDILAYSKSSRLPQKLVKDKNKFIQLDAYIGSLMDEGLIYIKGQPRSGVSLEEANQLIEEELEVIKQEPPTDFEMQKIKNFYESDQLYPKSIEDLASDLAKYELLGDANNYNTIVDRHNSVTAEQIMNMSKELLVKNNCSTLFYKRGKK